MVVNQQDYPNIFQGIGYGLLGVLAGALIAGIHFPAGKSDGSFLGIEVNKYSLVYTMLFFFLIQLIVIGILFSNKSKGIKNLIDGPASIPRQNKLITYIKFAIAIFFFIFTLVLQIEAENMKNSEQFMAELRVLALDIFLLTFSYYMIFSFAMLGPSFKMPQNSEKGYRRGYKAGLEILFVISCVGTLWMLLELTFL